MTCILKSHACIAPDAINSQHYQTDTFEIHLVHTCRFLYMEFLAVNKKLILYYHSSVYKYMHTHYCQYFERKKTQNH